MFAQEFMAGAGKQGVLLVSMGTVVELGVNIQPASYSSDICLMPSCLQTKARQRALSSRQQPFTPSLSAPALPLLQDFTGAS